MTSSNLSRAERIFLFFCLSVATFMIVLDYSIANVSIPYIAGDLSVSTDEGTYVITSFAVGNAIGLAMTGWLSKRIGQVRLLAASLALFTTLSWFCGASVSLEMLVICRFIQGFVAGPMVPLSQSLILSTGTQESRSRDLALWATIVITAPVLGPILGGYISEWHTWPWIFYINIPVGTFCAASIWFIMHKRDSEKQKAPLDIPGFVLLAIGVSALQILLDKGQQWDWMNSKVIVTLLIVSIVTFTLLIIREVFHKTPFLELRLFAIPVFSLSIVCLAVSYAIYFGSIVLIPLWLQEYQNFDAVWAGLTVSSLGIAPFLFSMFVPRVIKSLGNLMTLMISFAIFMAACFYNAYFTTAIDVFHVSFARFFFGVAVIFYINPLISMSVKEIPNDRLPSATGIFHFVRSMVGGVGTAVFTTLFERRTIFHHERIGETMTYFNPIIPSPLDQKGLALLNIALDQQAAVLALNDAFFLMGWLFAGLIVLLALWRFFRGSPKPHEPEAVHISAE